MSAPLGFRLASRIDEALPPVIEALAGTRSIARLYSESRLIEKTVLFLPIWLLTIHVFSPALCVTLDGEILGRWVFAMGVTTGAVIVTKSTALPT